MIHTNIPIFSSFALAFGCTKIFKKIYASFDSVKTYKSKKTILVIDPFTTLLNYKFSFWKFNYIFTKRHFTEEFIFNLGYMYDIIFITDNSLINKNIYDFIDPLGISVYRMYTRNKKGEIEHLKKENKVIILENKDTEDSCSLNIKPFGLLSPKYELFDVVNFLTTLNFMKEKNHIKILEFYKNKDFYISFDKIQKKLYQMRNMLNLFSVNRYEEIKKQIYKEKINNYKINKEELLKYK